MTLAGTAAQWRQIACSSSRHAWLEGCSRVTCTSLPKGTDLTMATERSCDDASTSVPVGTALPLRSHSPHHRTSQYVRHQTRRNFEFTYSEGVQRSPFHTAGGMRHHSTSAQPTDSSRPWMVRLANQVHKENPDINVDDDSRANYSSDVGSSKSKQGAHANRTGIVAQNQRGEAAQHLDRTPSPILPPTSRPAALNFVTSFLPVNVRAPRTTASKDSGLVKGGHAGPRESTYSNRGDQRGAQDSRQNQGGSDRYKGHSSNYGGSSSSSSRSWQGQAPASNLQHLSSPASIAQAVRGVTSVPQLAIIVTEFGTLMTPMTIVTAFTRLYGLLRDSSSEDRRCASPYLHRPQDKSPPPSKPSNPTSTTPAAGTASSSGSTSISSGTHDVQPGHPDVNQITEKVQAMKGILQQLVALAGPAITTGDLTARECAGCIWAVASLGPVINAGCVEILATALEGAPQSVIEGAIAEELSMMVWALGTLQHPAGSKMYDIIADRLMLPPPARCSARALSGHGLTNVLVGLQRAKHRNPDLVRMVSREAARKSNLLTLQFMNCAQLAGASVALGYADADVLMAAAARGTQLLQSGESVRPDDVHHLLVALATANQPHVSYTKAALARVASAPPDAYSPRLLVGVLWSVATLDYALLASVQQKEVLRRQFMKALSSGESLMLSQIQRLLFAGCKLGFLLDLNPVAVQAGTSPKDASPGGGAMGSEGGGDKGMVLDLRGESQHGKQLCESLLTVVRRCSAGDLVVLASICAQYGLDSPVLLDALTLRSLTQLSSMDAEERSTLAKAFVQLADRGSLGAVPAAAVDKLRLLAGASKQ